MPGYKYHRTETMERTRHCGTGNILNFTETNDLGPHRRFQRNRCRDWPYENKLELNTQATGTMATSGGRKSGVCRKLIYVGIFMSLNGNLSMVGTTPHETSTRNAQKMRQHIVLPAHIPQQKDGSAGKSSLAKHDVESTGMAPNKRLARQTDNIGSKTGWGHRKRDTKKDT